MSVISRLGSSNENLPDLLANYESELDAVEARIRVRGKSLNELMIEQAEWLLHYDTRRAELGTLVKHFEAQVDRVRGRLYKSYTEKYSRELSDRQKDRYIEQEEAFLSMNSLLLEVKELHTKYQAVVDAFIARGYGLKNLLDVRIHQLEHHVL